MQKWTDLKRRSLKWSATLGAAASVVLVAAGCGSSSSSSSSSTSASSSSASSAPAATTPAASTGSGLDIPSNATTMIGVVTDETGTIASYGEDMLRGVRLAISQANQQGGIDGHKLGLTIYDSASNFDGAGPLFLKLAANPAVIGIVGPDGSPYLANSGATIAKAAVPTVVPTSADAFPKGVLSKWTFRIAPIEGPAFTTLMKNIETLSPFKRLAIVSDPSNPISVSEASELEALAPTLGFKVVDTATAPETETNFSTIVTKLEAADPDAIWDSLVTQGAAELMKEVRQVGIKATFMGGATIGNSPQIFQLAGSAGNGTYTFVAFDAQSTDAATQKLDSEFQSTYHVAPDNQSALSYVGAKVLLAAIAKAGVSATGQTERNAIQAALAHLSNVPGVTGNVSYNGGPENVTPRFEIVKVVNGQFHVVKTITP